MNTRWKAMASIAIAAALVIAPLAATGAVADGGAAARYFGG